MSLECMVTDWRIYNECILLHVPCESFSLGGSLGKIALHVTSGAVAKFLIFPWRDAHGKEVEVLRCEECGEHVPPEILDALSLDTRWCYGYWHKTWEDHARDRGVHEEE